MKKRCIVVSGLPASGKSTIGRKLADSLHFNFVDKDDYLERLYDERGVGDLAWRQSLSRESDSLFIHDAKLLDSAVLVSHWRTNAISVSSGTPTDWIHEEFFAVVELHCSCSVETAATRFHDRVRHPGHLDDQKTFEDILFWMTEYQQGLPLEFGSHILAETDARVSIDDIIVKIERQLSVNTSDGTANRQT